VGGSDQRDLGSGKSQDEEQMYHYQTSRRCQATFWRCRATFWRCRESVKKGADLWELEVEQYWLKIAKACMKNSEQMSSGLASGYMNNLNSNRKTFDDQKLEKKSLSL